MNVKGKMCVDENTHTHTLTSFIYYFLDFDENKAPCNQDLKNIEFVNWCRNFK